MSNRVEGKHHYAEIDERSGVPMWIVCRTTDDHPIHRVSAEFWDAGAIRSSYMEPADAAADHFIEQGRKEAFAEVNGLAEKLVANPVAGLYNETDDWSAQNRKRFFEALRAAAGGGE